MNIYIRSGKYILCCINLMFEVLNKSLSIVIEWCWRNSPKDNYNSDYSFPSLLILSNECVRKMIWINLDGKL